MHIKCDNLNFLDHQYLNGNDDPWFCLKCNTELFPFGTLNNKTFNQYINSSNIQSKDIDQDNSCNLVLKPPPNLKSLFNQFNNSSQIHDFIDPENGVSCKYYNLEEVQTMKIPNKKNSLSLFHINACSLSKNFDDLEYLLKTTNTNFDIIAISETRILKNTKIAKNINIPNFSYEFTPTESTAEGTLIYIADHLTYQKRDYLNYLESTFIEITNPSKTSIIVGYNYRHPTMDLSEFNYYYLNPLLEKLANEKKTVFLLGDFNVDLFKYEHHKATNEFLDSLSSNMVLPYIIQPTRITSHSKSIIDKSFSNYISQEIILGNLTSTISDHLPQFLIAPHIFSNVPNKKSNIFELNWCKFNREEFILDYFAIDKPHISKLQNNDTNTSFQSFSESMNRILDKHAPLKRLSKYKLKFKTERWITMVLQKSISIKNKLFSDYINKKDLSQKTELHIKYKS